MCNLRLTVFATAISLGLSGTMVLAKGDPNAKLKDLPSAAQSQGGGGSGALFVGEGSGGTSTSFRVDVVSGDSIQAFSGANVSGAAHDAGQNRVFFVQGPILSEWPIDGALTPLGTITDAATGLVNLAMTGLAVSNGTLYGCGGSSSNKAIFAIGFISLFDPRGTVHIDFNDDDFDCGDLAFNPEDGAFYMVNNDPTPLGRGLYRMNADGSGTLVTPYPAGETSVGGLAIGNGRAYLVPNAPGNIYVYDLGLAAYQTPLPSPFTSSTMTSSGAAWITPDAIFAGSFD